ncbi:MAG: signal peptidase I [Clostridia bacterium]|nr:signal peptidase I [Clostridia bacterium]
MAEDRKEKKPISAKRVVSIVLTVLFVVIIVATVIALVHIKTAKDPSLFGYGVYTVVSGSMTPTLRVGDVIFVKKVTDPAELAKGDIITFRGQGKLAGKVVTHRIVSDGVEADGKITTCGDANYGLQDDPITMDDVIGKMIRKATVFSALHRAFTSKVGFALIVIVPLMILLIIQFVNFVRACKMDKDGHVKEEDTEPSQEEKDRQLIEEYLKRQKRIRDAENKKKK